MARAVPENAQTSLVTRVLQTPLGMVWARYAPRAENQGKTVEKQAADRG